jgi:hypothetical protein
MGGLVNTVEEPYQHYPITLDFISIAFVMVASDEAFFKNWLSPL